jgi:hypothetical protein
MNIEERIVSLEKRISEIESKTPIRIAKRPTIEECEEHFASKGFPRAEGTKFFNYWDSIGWMRGRSTIKNWKSAAATWMQNIKKTESYFEVN